jgi:hypothetical protein
MVDIAVKHRDPLLWDELAYANVLASNHMELGLGEVPFRPKFVAEMTLLALFPIICICALKHSSIPNKLEIKWDIVSPVIRTIN